MALVNFAPTELDSIRRYADSIGVLSPALKADINNGAQAIETWLEGGFSVRPATSLSVAIDAATSPLVFSVAQKKLLMRAWLNGLFQRGGF